MLNQHSGARVTGPGRVSIHELPHADSKALYTLPPRLHIAYCVAIASEARHGVEMREAWEMNNLVDL